MGCIDDIGRIVFGGTGRIGQAYLKIIRTDRIAGKQHTRSNLHLTSATQGHIDPVLTNHSIFLSVGPDIVQGPSRWRIRSIGEVAIS